MARLPSRELNMWQTYLQPRSLSEALELLAHHGSEARVIAGGTDVLVELSRGVRPTATLIDITRINELRYIREADGIIALGGLTTHNDVVASKACVDRALPLAQACWEVGAPQLRTRGTIAGNLATASPANDTITPLMALGAELVLVSADGERTVPLAEFYLGVRRTVLRPSELIREIRVPALSDRRRGIFVKLGLRRAQAISVIDATVVLAMNGERVESAAIALGSVAPTIVRAETAEAFLVGKVLDATSSREAGRLAAAAIQPIGDVRGSAEYRRQTVERLVAQALERVAAGKEREGFPAEPVLLDTRPGVPPTNSSTVFDGVVETTINGRPVRWAAAVGKTLLDAIREDGGLTGTKEGCAEGECGACTVWLDGQAVMSCLVPAPQAQGAAVTTIEGLAAADGRLHPLQEAFIARGAVQCGYCIPGMLMAGAKLLEERAGPDPETIKVALSGNICRCTGYRKIVEAVQTAAVVGAES